MGNIHTVGPNEALIISGGWCGSTTKKMIIGGWAWVWWAVNDVQVLSLEVFSLKPKCESVETSQGVPLCVTGVAQCKIMTQNEFLTLAAEQFLGMSIKQIKSVLLETLEGHLRAILGTLSVEEIYRDRDKFANLVREVATPDVGRMGIEIVSFTIKDIYDTVDYLSSLGRGRVAEVKRDAQMGQALCERDAGIVEIQSKRESLDIQFESNAKTEDSKRNYQMQRSLFDSEVNTQKANTQLAYELQSTKLQQMIRNEQKQIDLVERSKQIELEESEVLRKEKELYCHVHLPTESEAYKISLEALANKNSKMMLAEAEATRIKIIGEAEAKRIQMIGAAEADAMRLRAESMANFNDAAIMSQACEVMPDLARLVCQPLSRTSEIVINSSTNEATVANGINSFLAQVPSSVKALSGIDLGKFLASKMEVEQTGGSV